MKFYADENFPLDTVIELRRLGHDVLTAFEDRRSHRGIADEKVLTRASKLSRAVLTINRRDFLRLHRIDDDHSGVIICTQDPEFSRQAQIIHRNCGPHKDLYGQLIRVYRPQVFDDKK